MEVTVREVKTHLSQLLERVSLGEEITITRAGEPVARHVPAAKSPHRRRLGWGVGEFSVPGDFDAPLPANVEESFYK
jgi:prevent-host-death family protein